MTEEEAKIFLQKFQEFVEETRDNFSHIFKDRQNDHLLWEDIYKIVGKSTCESHMLVSKVDEAADELKNQLKENTQKVEVNTQEVLHAADALKDDIASNTKIVIKEVDKPRKRWWKFWQKKNF